MINPRKLIDRDLTRRAFLRATLAGTGLCSLPQILAWRVQGAITSPGRQRSLILLWQDGGPSHFETFDPKPEAPTEYRGELGAISTSLSGINYCEVLPRLAALAHRTAIVRSLHQPSSDHVVGSHNVLTGWYDQTEAGRSRFPDLASVINRMRSGTESAGISLGASTDPRLARGMRRTGGTATIDASQSLPGYIDINSGLHRGGPAFLGPVDGPFRIAGDPSKPGFTIQNLDSVEDLSRFRARQAMLADLDRFDHQSVTGPRGFEQFGAMDRFRRQAIELISGGTAARAFDLSRERPEVRERYGRHLAGQQCLLARRLVEAGVGVVAVRFSPDGRGDYDRTMIGWDDHAVHGNIFEIMRQRGPQFDQSVSALIEDLDQRGLHDDVLLVVVGEFGRTPRIHVHKGCPGREHWGPAGCALIYGGGLHMGQVVGSTNSRGEQPHDRPVTYQSLLATLYHALGINPAHTFLNPAGRPVPILPAGEPIAELTGGHTTPREAQRRDTIRIDPALTGDGPNPEGMSWTLPEGAVSADLADIPHCDQMRSLCLRDTEITDDGLRLLRECRLLRRLDLNGTAVTDAGLVHLSGLTQLEELLLTGTHTSDAGLAALRELRQLRSLAINGTSISLNGVVRLFVDIQKRSLVATLAALELAVLDRLGRVETINVAGTALGDNELQSLGRQTSLRELHLAATRVTDLGLARLEPLENLERLYLAKCDVTDAGLAHLVRHPRLQTLNLVGTQVTSTGLAVLGELRGLRSLLITDLKLRPAAVDELKSRLPQLIVTDYTPVQD